MLSDRLLSRKRRRRTWFAASPRPLQSFARPSPVTESSRIDCSPDLKLNAGGTQPSAPVVQINLDPPQAEPIKLIRSQCQQIRQLPDPGKQVPSEHFDWDVSLVPPQIQFHRLCRTRKIVYHQNFLSAQLTNVCQHSVIRRIEEFNRPAAKYLK